MGIWYRFSLSVGRFSVVGLISFHFFKREFAVVILSVADPGCLSRIRLFSYRFRIFPSQIRIKEMKYFNPRKWFLSSRKYVPGCSSRIRILTFYPSGSRGQKGTGSRIRIRNTSYFLLSRHLFYFLNLSFDILRRMLGWLSLAL